MLWIQNVISRMLKPQTKILDRTNSVSPPPTPPVGERKKIPKKRNGDNITHYTWRFGYAALVGSFGNS